MCMHSTLARRQVRRFLHGLRHRGSCLRVVGVNIDCVDLPRYQISLDVGDDVNAKMCQMRMRSTRAPGKETVLRGIQLSGFVVTRP